jgi:hypothetical protein
MQTYTNLDGIECVIIDNEDGSTWSGLKSTYNEIIAKQELSAE